MGRPGMYPNRASTLAVMVCGCLAAALPATGCTTPKLLADRAQGQMARGQLDAAEKTLERAEEMHPASWRTQMLFGRLYLKQDRPAEAETALRRALNLRPTHEQTDDILDLLAEAYYQQGEASERALRRFLDAQLRDRGTARDYARKGRFLARLGDADEAIIALRQALSLDPTGDAEIHKAMAEFYRGIGDKDAELKSLRHAYYLDPTDRNVADRMRELNFIPGPTAGLPPQPQ